MDTFKDKQLLEDMYSRGEAPWEVWKSSGASQPLLQKTMTRGWQSDDHQEQVR
jgi:hypothetical protein